MMNFYRWSFNEPLKINKYGIPEPITKKIYPEVLLIPLLAFDKYLNRLGYGGVIMIDTYQEFMIKIKLLR